MLSQKLWFPAPEEASPEGILAIGDDLSVERLELAYKRGVFPWFSEGDPIVWYSPDPRMVLFPEKVKVSKSMQQIIRKGNFKITFNQNFEEVIKNCRTIDRTAQYQFDTWITNDMEQAYINLHKAGLAKSVEVWQDKELIGGLYGVDLGHIFCGESMFSKVSNASKLAFIYLAQRCEELNYKLIDCQIYNEHLASLGAEEIPRKEFLKYL